jgi:multiple sugar transport system permease protein
MSGTEAIIRYTRDILPENHFDINSGTIHYVNMSAMPNEVTLSQYLRLLFDNPAYLTAFINSVKLTLPIVLGQIIIGVPTAYAFEIGDFDYKEQLFFLYIVVMFLPLQVSLVPNYMTIEFLNIDSDFAAIVLPAVFSPFPVFLFRQYIKSLSLEYIEAAQIDGAGHFRIILRIVLPLFKPAVAAVALLSFTNYWNMVEQAIVFIDNAYDMPLSVYLPTVAGLNSGTAFAASVFYMLPALIIFMYGRKELAAGIQNSAVKL